MARRRRRAAVLMLAITALAIPNRVTAETASLAIETEVPGLGAARPRVAFDPDYETVLRDRLGREPYATVFRNLHARTRSYLASTVGDPTIVAQRNLSRAAKGLAFEFALDRTVADGTIVPFPDSDARAAIGEEVETLLLAMYDRSRLAVPAPLGGFDRDINTSEEIISYATAFDTMLGAGWDFGDNHAEIVDRLHRLAGELYTNYAHPESVDNIVDLNQNNHRTKSGAAIAVAAVVLADEIDDGDARDWFDLGAREVDDILRFVMQAGDGGYSEGPYYYRYSMQNVLPYLAVWERFLGDAAWTTRAGLVVPSYLHDPAFGRAQRWMFDTLVPDGTMAPIDDGNPGRSYYWGALPTTLPTSTRAAAADRWPDTPQPFETDGSIDLSVESIVAYDDAITPAPPPWDPTQFYEESGVAVLRSGWESDDVAVFALAEHGTASEFGRDRTGAGRAPQSHEHPDPGSFMLYAHGERLLLDPGYLTFGTHALVNQPQDHNIVLVDGTGPRDPLVASLQWLPDLFGAPPNDGDSTMYDTLDSTGVDRVSIVSNYGAAPITIERDLSLIADRYLIVVDEVATTDGLEHELAWQLHGNGGGTSGGTFENTPTGGRWTIGAGRVDAAFATPDAEYTQSTRLDEHEVPYGQLRNHTALVTTQTSAATSMLHVLVPTASDAAPPTITDRSGGGLAALRVVDGTRRVDAYARRDGDAIVDLSAGVRTDGRALTIVRDANGWNTIHATDATFVEVDGVRIAEQATRGTLGWHHADDAVEFIATGAGARVIRAPLTEQVQHACASRIAGPWLVPTLLPGVERVVMDSALTAAPAASATRTRTAAVGDVVIVDGRACDADGHAVQWQWELVSSPPGSVTQLLAATTGAPSLIPDRPGPYRLRGRVVDETGAASDDLDVLIVAGDRGANDIDDDLDGRIDLADPDGDGAPPADAVIVAADGTIRGATNALDALTVTFTRGTGVAGAVSRIRVAADAGGETFVLADLRRRGGAWSGRLAFVDLATATIVDADVGALVVTRIDERSWRLDAPQFDIVLIDGAWAAQL